MAGKTIFYSHPNATVFVFATATVCILRHATQQTHAHTHTHKKKTCCPPHPLLPPSIPPPSPAHLPPTVITPPTADIPRRRRKRNRCFRSAGSHRHPPKSKRGQFLRSVVSAVLRRVPTGCGIRRGFGDDTQPGLRKPSREGEVGESGVFTGSPRACWTTCIVR